jgi:hypothetical protein
MSLKVKLISQFKALLDRRLLGADKSGKKALRSKHSILDFFLKNERWPSRLSRYKNEKSLGYRFENFMSKESASFDPEFRKLVMANGRKTNNKRKHKVKQFKKDIIAFMEEHGRAPATHRAYEATEGESLLRSRLDYYTEKCNDTTLLGEVYSLDPCHKSGIPLKYRALINKDLNVQKPLIRLV